MIGPVDPDSITIDDKNKALRAVHLIKEKIYGRNKVITCANGAKKRRYFKEGKIISSSTVFLKSIIATLVIESFEERFIAIADIPGAYLHAEMPKCNRVVLKLKSQFLDIMCQVNPEYTKYVRYEKDIKVLDLWVLRAIYGCLELTLLCYNSYMYSSTLVGICFR